MLLRVQFYLFYGNKQQKEVRVSVDAELAKRCKNNYLGALLKEFTSFCRGNENMTEINK